MSTSKGFEAFENVPLLDLTGEAGSNGGMGGKTEITSFDKCEDKLFCGTSNGHVLYFLVEEVPDCPPRCNGQLKKYLGQGKRPVTQLIVLEKLEKIMVLCDGVLLLLNIITLQIEYTGTSSLKGVTAFSQDAATRQSANVHIACVRKKTLTFYELNGDKLILHKEWPLRETSSHFAWSGSKVCLAFQREYCLLNVESGRTTTLFPFDSSLTSPLVICVGPSEFLLTVSAAANVTLGMFVTGRGDTARAPLQWNEIPIKICYAYPYVVGVNKSSIEVHNIKDQQLKQSIPFSQGKRLAYEHSDILLGAGKRLYILNRINIHSQVRSLLTIKTSEAVSEALDLAETYPFESVEEKNNVIRSARVKCAFVYLELKEYASALSLLVESSLDPREVIVLYEGLSICGFDFERDRSLCEYESIEKLFEFDKDAIMEAKRFLLQYLEISRNPASEDVQLKQYVDTVLLELYCSDIDVGTEQERSRSLKQLLISENECLFWESKAILEDNFKHHCTALLCKSNGKPIVALDIWDRLAKGEITDVDFDGVKEPVKYLCLLKDQKLVFKYSRFYLAKFPLQSLSIFMSRNFQENDEIPYHACLDFLEQTNELVYFLVLHSVVYSDLAGEETKYCDRLGELYLMHIERMIGQEGDIRPFTPYSFAVEPSFIQDIWAGTQFGDSEEGKTIEDVTLPEMRLLLCIFLSRSMISDKQAMLGRLRTMGLSAEKAIVLGTLGNHEDALSIIACEVGDFRWAEVYCLNDGVIDFDNYNLSPTKTRERRCLTDYSRGDILLILLKVYLKQNPNSEVSDKTQKFVVEAISLLNAHGRDLDILKVLELIPLHWSTGIVSRYFISSLRHHSHLARSTRIKRRLYEEQAKILAYARVTNESANTVVNSSSRCVICRLGFLASDVFVRFPSGSISHLHCCKNVGKL
eukprot:Nk52_evm13s2209 gene=Nk52_evmTU13s2209